MKRFVLLVCAFLLLLAGGAASALEFGSVSAPSAALYAAPDLQARKLYVASRYTPFEIVVALKDWVRVRGQDGSLAWVQRNALGNAHFVVVTADLAEVREKPDASAPVLFRVRKQVALELLEDTRVGWLRIRHPDGSSGYIKATEVWGG